MHRDKWNNYNSKNIKFIDVNKDRIFHQVYINFVKANPDIKSILEIGPGRLGEYPIIKQIRPIIYDVVEISKPFIQYCHEHYPEITIIESLIEQYIYTDYSHHSFQEYDLVRLSDVIEHTSPVQAAIKNIITCAKKFHITMFKWVSTGNGLQSANIRKDSDGVKYYSTRYSLIDIINEINLYGQIESAIVIDELLKTTISLIDYWNRNRFGRLPPLPSARKLRIILTGTRL